MHIEKRGLNKKALLFEASGVNALGEYVVSSTWDEIDCNWEETNDKGTDAKGNEVAITARIRVNQAVPIGSIVWLGNRDEISGTAEPPEPETDFLQVVSINLSFDVKGREVGRMLNLTRYNKSLPTS